jgi:hypothetical protein
MDITRRHLWMALGGALPLSCLVAARKRYSSVPFLITVDVHKRPNLYDEINRCLDRLAESSLQVTFLVVANLTGDIQIRRVLRRIITEGHQVGCHGLTHEGDEDYYTNPVAVQEKNLACAKQLLEQALGTSVGTFRAPAFRISHETLQVLDSLGYVADLSVCSERLPLLSSQIGNYQWMCSPRTPYHPRQNNPYERGALALLEIPTSAALVPLMSSVNSVSVLLNEIVTNILKYEASIIRKPIVYQCHPEDFILYEQHQQHFHFAWRSLLPSDRYGIPLRWALQETDGRVLFQRNQQFLAFLRNTQTFQFMTVDGYIMVHGKTLGG